MTIPWARFALIAGTEQATQKAMSALPPTAFVYMFKRWRERTSDDTMP